MSDHEHNWTVWDDYGKVIEGVDTAEAKRHVEGWTKDNPGIYAECDVPGCDAMMPEEV